MKLTSDDLAALRCVAVHAVQQAAEYIRVFVSALKKDSSTLTIMDKCGGSSPASNIVTQVDYHCDKLIRQCLADSIHHYHLAILTEECADDLQRFSKDYFWCVDPLDGTLAFTEGREGYAVSVALVSKAGQPLVAAVANASDGTYYSAIVGQGLWKNNAPWQPINNASSAVLTLACDRSLIDGDTKLASNTLNSPSVRSQDKGVLAMLDAFATQQGFNELVVLEPAGAVMNALYVLQYQPALYLKLPKLATGGGSTWDFSATALLFIEASAAVTDTYGKPLSLNNPTTTFMNHCGVLFASDRRLSQNLLRYLAEQGCV